MTATITTITMVNFLNFNVSLWHQTENIFKDNETKNARPFVHVVIHCGYKCWRHIREKKRITSVLELVLNFESLQCQIGPVLLYFDSLKLHCMLRLHCLICLLRYFQSARETLITFNHNHHQIYYQHWNHQYHF